MSSDEHILEFKTAGEALDFAISKEEEASRFYAEWAERLTNNAIREVFLEFSQVELKHKEKLLAAKSGSISLEPQHGVTDLKLTDYFRETAPSPGMTYQDALLVAVQKERAAYETYAQLASAYGASELGQLFEALAEEESKHKLKLESFYDDTFMKED